MKFNEYIYIKKSQNVFSYMSLSPWTHAKLTSGLCRPLSAGWGRKGTCFWALVNTLQWEESQIMSILGKLGSLTKSWSDPNGELDSSINIRWPRIHSTASL